MANEIKNKYYVLKYDTDVLFTGEKITIQYLDLKSDVKSYHKLKNEDFKAQIKSRIDKEQNGLFYKGFEICFTYKNESFYISHHHQSEDFIKDIIEIIKYNNGQDIFIKYGELD